MNTKDYHDAANKLSVYVTGFQIANGTGAFILTEPVPVKDRRDAALHFFYVIDNPTQYTKSDICKMIGLMAANILKGLLEKWQRQNEQTFKKILNKLK